MLRYVPEGVEGDRRRGAGFEGLDDFQGIEVDDGQGVVLFIGHVGAFGLGAEGELAAKMKELLERCEAPACQFERMGL